jgi:hypothetical protein
VHSYDHILRGVGVIDTLDLDQARFRMGNMSTTLVAEVAAPDANVVSFRCRIASQYPSQKVLPSRVLSDAVM